MARVKLTTSLSGPAGAWGRAIFMNAGPMRQTRLIKAGFAVPAEPKIERAVAKPVTETRKKKATD